MKTRIFHLHALSALHIGTGQGVGTVDLPIARSRATNLPLVPGSSLKGVLRDSAKTQWDKLDENDINALFGSESTVDETHASAVAFGDAHLLLLPVRSFAGTVAYATCPFILQRYARDMKLKHKQVQLKDNTAALCAGSELLIKNHAKIALEDLDMDAAADENAQEWAKTIADALYPDGVDDAEDWKKQFTERFVVLPDNVFSFLADTATEIRMRIRIDSEKRIVKQGALWSEENLPAEAVLWGVMGIDKGRNGKNAKSAAELSAKIPTGETHIQIGGKHTVGRGLCRLMIGAEQEGGQS